MILNCGRHFHPAIQSALHKVRFHMGYCSSVQLVKRLNALDREFHRDAHGRETEVELSDAEKHRVSVKVEAWMRVRWDIIDRWELAKMVKDEVLVKVGRDVPNMFTPTADQSFPGRSPRSRRTCEIWCKVLCATFSCHQRRFPLSVRTPPISRLAGFVQIVAGTSADRLYRRH